LALRTAVSTSLRSARSVPSTRSSGATWPLIMVSSGFSDSALPSIAVAAPIRPPLRRYSSVST
jgi:hypothetical protein